MADTDIKRKVRRSPIASKTVAMRVEMIERIEQRADDDGHGNFSKVVTDAVDAYLGDEEAQSETAVA